MRRLRRLVERARSAPHNIDFNDLLWVIKRCGYEGKQRKGTSHWVYLHPAHPLLFLNIQRSRGKAKAYQVRQLLEQIDDFDLLSGVLDD